MSLPKILLLVAACLSLTYADDVTDGTELLMTFLVHRHGDRTPASSQVSYSTDPALLEELTAAYGYGQLTEAGMRRGYAIGKFIRQRYDAFLSDRYNKSEIYIRSTEYTRTRMTILSALTAVYPVVGEGWNPSINWTPVPYTTTQAVYDTNLSFGSCPTYVSANTNLYLATSDELEAYSDLFVEIAEKLGVDLTTYPAYVSVLEDTYACQISLGMELTGDALRLWPRINEAAAAAFKIIWGTDEYLNLQAGPLIKEFHDLVKEIVAGEDIPRVRILSSHDFNVFSLMAISQVPLTIAKFGSVFALELRQVTSTGQYVVLPVFKQYGDSPAQYLQVKGCDLLCDYDQFLNITSPYILNTTEWRTKCGWYEDLTVTIE